MLLNPSHQAFACSATAHDGGAEGLTAREYMATHILAGIVPCFDLDVADNLEDVADMAVRMADALIARLNQPG